MFKLTITHADGTHYWTEYFSERVLAEEWLAVEQTRPYWKQDFVADILDTTPPPDPNAAEKELAEKARLEARAQAYERLKTVDIDKASTVTALRAIVKDLAELLK